MRLPALRATGARRGDVHAVTFTEGADAACEVVGFGVQGGGYGVYVELWMISCFHLHSVRYLNGMRGSWERVKKGV